MRIALDVRPLQNASAGRGVGRYVRSLIEHLPATGDGYLLLESRWFPGGEWRERPDAERVELARPPRAITAFDQVATPLLCLAKRIDVFHSTFYALPRVGTRHTARIITVHDLIPLIIPGVTSVKNTAIFGQIYRSARRADAVIVPSRRTAEDLSSRIGVPAERIRIIPMGVGEPFLAPAPASGALPTPAQALPEPVQAVLAKGGRLLVYNGGFDATKNVSFLIEALGALADETACLCIVGDSGAARASLDEAARRRGVGDRVVFVGRLTDAELAALYRNADVFVSASRYEGFGLPPLEAMACGCPVVALSSGAVPEVLAGAALAVEDADAAAFASAIRRVLDDAGLRHTLAAQGRARAQTLTWSRTAAATHALYRDVAGEAS